MVLAIARRRPWLASAGGLGLVLFVAAAWFLVSPLFIRSTLVEAPAGAAAAPVARGTFNEIDAVHKGRGQAVLSRAPDGRLVVRLEEFSVTNGPDLHVFLSRHAAPTGDAQVKDGVLLGKLKAPEGAFGYETETPLDPAEFKSVVIHCVAFRTIFSVAALR
jgi:hypothetical protein